MRRWNGKSERSSKNKGGKRKRQNVAMVRWLTRFVSWIQNISASALNHVLKWRSLIVPCPSISVGDDAEALTPGIPVMLEYSDVLIWPEKLRRIASKFVIMHDAIYPIAKGKILCGVTMRKRENGKESGGICSLLVVVLLVFKTDGEGLKFTDANVDLTGVDGTGHLLEGADRVALAVAAGPSGTSCDA